MKDKIQEIRNELTPYVGKAVHLYVVGDRNRILNTTGVLDGVYSDIFTVAVQNDSYLRRYCYTYSEMLVGNVKVHPALQSTPASS